jgi:peroxiredoxin
MLLSSLRVPIPEFEAASGWEIRAEGACRDGRCVPLPPGAVRDDATFDVRVFAEHLRMPIAHDEEHGLFALGPGTGGRVIRDARCPEIRLPDLDGHELSLASLGGRKLVLVAWASWCGCRDDLPGWQALHEELSPRGVTIVTAAMDAGGPAAVRAWVERAKPRHPALIDAAHSLGAKLGFLNVPTSAWIDEAGMLVRLGDVAAIRENKLARTQISPALPWRMQETLREAQKIRTDPAAYLAALRDWAHRGAASRFALAPDELLRRARPCTAEFGLAAAHFKLGQHLLRSGHTSDAVPHFRAAHRLAPEDWTWKRQAWSLADPNQGPTELYESDWLSDVKRLGGGEHYYPPFEP